MDRPTTPTLQRQCRGCGGTIIKVEHQTRAADEAQTIIWTCDKCPFDSRKVDAALSPPRLPFRHSISIPRSVGLNLGGVPGERKQTTILRAPIDVDSIKKLNVRFTPHYVSRLKVMMDLSDSHCTLVDYYHTGNFAGTSVTYGKPSNVGLGISTIKCDVTTYPPGVTSPTKERCGVVSDISIPGSDWAHLLWDGADKSGVIEMCVEHSSTEEAIGILLDAIIPFSNISAVFDRGKVRSLRNLAPRAWDMPVEDRGNRLYTSKVDGERSWCVIDSYVAIYFKHGGDRRSWSYSTVVPPLKSSSPVVIDLEYCGPYGSFFIDCLTDSDGSLSPPNRAMDWSILTFNSLELKYRGLNIALRSYFRTLKDADSYCRSLRYPVDGVISIPDGGTSAEKLKSFRSVELRVGADRKLYTEEGKLALASVAIPRRFGVQDIIEVRFKESKQRGCIAVSECFVRPDKVTANTSEAFASILSSLSTADNTDDSDRRIALVWCNALRKKVFQMATDSVSNRNVVLNVGAGNGQSLDELMTDKSLSFLHIEPSRESCEKLAQRAGVNSIGTSPRDVMSSVRGLKTRSIQSCVICCTLEDLLRDEEVCSLIMREVRCVVATFSAQYMRAALWHLSEAWGLPVYGCFYAYDEVEVGQALIDSCGVLMKRTSSSTCKVRWGGDKSYDEPYVTSAMYSSHFTVVRAADVIGLPSHTDDSKPNSICSHVYVIMP